MAQDYDTWPIRQLQDECRSRGLASGRVKADLVYRLLEQDAAGEGIVTAESDVPPAPLPQPTEPRPPAPVHPAAATFRLTLPHSSAGLDDATHLNYRRRTWEAAIEQGLAPRGGELGAWRAGTTADGEVYEIGLKPRVAL